MDFIPNDLLLLPFPCCTGEALPWILDKDTTPASAFDVVVARDIPKDHIPLSKKATDLSRKYFEISKRKIAFFCPSAANKLINKHQRQQQQSSGIGIESINLQSL